MSGIRGGFRNPLVSGASIPPGTIDSGHLADGAVTSLKLGVNLQSDNYDGGVVSVDPGTQGWRIERTTGDIAVNNAFIRGILEASIFRTAASGERLVLDGSNNETFITIFNSSNQVVGQMGFAPTGWGSDQMVFYGGSGTGGVVVASDGSIDLDAVGSSGTGVRIANASPSGGTPGKPFVVAGVMRLHNSTNAATPTWARDADPDTGVNFPGSNQVGFTTGGANRLTVTTGTVNVTLPIRGPNGSASAPAYSFSGGTNYGMWKVGNALAFAASGKDVFRIDSGRVWYIPTDYPDVGNVEVLRADRTGSTTALNPLGYFSSREANKRNITPLSRSRFWRREWFMELEPVTFIRRSTKGREFGFVIDQFQRVHDNLKYLTTKGNEWGASLDEFGLLAVTVDYVQHLESRVRRLEDLIRRVEPLESRAA